MFALIKYDCGCSWQNCLSHLSWLAQRVSKPNGRRFDSLLVQHFLVLADFAWYCVSGVLHGALVGFDGGRAWWLASARFFFRVSVSWCGGWPRNFFGNPLVRARNIPLALFFVLI